MATKSNIIAFPLKVKRIYRLRIELEETKPAIYRQLLVRGDIGLDLLHTILQVAMGWTNSHPHRFTIGKHEYSNRVFETNDMVSRGDSTVEEEAIIKLDEAAKGKGFQFGYDYDFGDFWRHRIIVEETLPDDGTLAGFALCIGGRRACPPEDCGGVGGYADLLEIIADPEHAEHESMLEWLGGSFDADAFDRDKVNVFLRKLKWGHPTIGQLGGVLMARDKIKTEKKKKTGRRK